MSNKFQWTEENAMKPIKMTDLICKDCFHRSPPTAICAVYPNCKPLKVLKGGNCEYYKKG